MMRQEVVKVLANEESNPAELEAESSAPRSELLANHPLYVIPRATWTFRLFCPVLLAARDLVR